MEGRLADQALLSSSSNAKGAGKTGLGKGKHGAGGLGKGGLGKGGLGKGQKPEVVPPPKSQEALTDEAMNKCRKMRDMAGATTSSFEEALALVKRCKFWSKAAERDALALLETLKECALELKGFLMRKHPDMESMKVSVLAAAFKVKECQAEIREFKQLANKTSSKASARK